MVCTTDTVSQHRGLASRVLPGSGLRLTAALAGMAMMAGCATVPPPPPPPPPPPVVKYIPFKPTPPNGASPIMTIPAVGLDGNRLTVNYALSTAQTTWNLRSALNVAALNCLDPQHAGILPAYTSYLDRFDKKLRTTNNTLLGEFRERHGRREGQGAYDDYMTKVYNYFALPPALDAFCDAALAVANDSAVVAAEDLDSFSMRSLPRLEGVFEDFFRSFEAYQYNLANWTSVYGYSAVPGSALPQGFDDSAYRPITSAQIPMTRAATAPQPDGLRTGSLGSTPGEQVVFRETPEGTALPETAGTVTVLPGAAPDAGVAATPAPAPVIVAQLPESDAPVTVIDPGASAADTVGASATPGFELMPTEPVTSDTDVVFTSQPVVQAAPEDEAE